MNSAFFVGPGSRLDVTNCDFVGFESIAEVAPQGEIHFSHCKGRDTHGPTLLKHPTARATKANSHFVDMRSVWHTEKALTEFRNRYRIPKEISDAEILSFAGELRACRDRFQRETKFRRDPTGQKLKQWFERRSFGDLVGLSGTLIALYVALKGT